ncbi:restriction endonuclease subunit S [Pseudomonas folii]|uniref:Restriction endonuclease subunit S n=1 Tax=Pseudomonas folii TaxID=2762593 RepID=A0ABR7AXH9_9PSED|nr:restriction endonuclease subunit S [Pseudomonas folii]MBC3949643.1 restriction endonuclease subunit S [Pseudomonas folii]
MSELPIGWSLAQLGELAGVNPKQNFDDELVAGFVPMSHAPTNFRDKLRFDERNWGEIKKAYTNFKDGDVIFAKVTPCFENGKAALVSGLPNGIGAGSSEFFVLRPGSAEVSAKYMLALIKSHGFMREGAANMTGAVGLRRVPRQFVENYVVPVPPAAEQTRIAQKLDELLAQVDTLNARMDGIPVLLKSFRQSVLAAAANGRLTRELNAAELTNWSYLKAADVCDKVQSGGTPKEGFSNEGTPFLKVYNIVKQKIDFENRPQYIPIPIHKGSAAKSITRAGDVVMNIVGPPLGKIATIPATHEEWNINQAITLFRPSSKIISGWISIVLEGGDSLRNIMNETKGSAGQVNISLSQCRNFVFPVPSLAEQREIVRRVEQLFAFADQLEAKVASAKTRIDHLTQSILAKAFRGELVPQDPNDEPASILLERIKAQRAATPKAKRGRKASA